MDHRGLRVMTVVYILRLRIFLGWPKKTSKYYYFKNVCHKIPSLLTLIRMNSLTLLTTFSHSWLYPINVNLHSTHVKMCLFLWQCTSKHFLLQLFLFLLKGNNMRLTIKMWHIFFTIQNFISSFFNKNEKRSIMTSIYRRNQNTFMSTFFSSKSYLTQQSVTDFDSTINA